MCKVKVGKHIENYGDVQNIIIGTILRQRKEYRYDHILDTVMSYCQGAQFAVDVMKAKKMVLESLDILQRNNRIKCRNGKFETQHVLPIKNGQW